jgi:hypothetical protein
MSVESEKSPWQKYLSHRVKKILTQSNWINKKTLAMTRVGQILIFWCHEIHRNSSGKTLRVYLDKHPMMEEMKYKGDFLQNKSLS